MTNDFQTLMQRAAGLTREGRLQEATATVQRALGGHAAAAFQPGPWPNPMPGMPGMAGAAAPEPTGAVIDGCVFEIGAGTQPLRDAAAPHGESFLGAVHANGSITGNYKLYVPPQVPDEGCALVVMLHGCTQDPDDFAAGTHMNSLARAAGIHVLYPAQSQQANPQRCWNWFKHNHQQRGRGEPAWIASLTQEVTRDHGIDPRRVYIAGLSAGGAMAALVAAAYPDIFAAVGVHSGLAPGVAVNLPDALAAMQGKGGGAGVVPPQRLHSARPGQAPSPRPALSVPTIVFHGDRDATVHPRNGQEVLEAALRGAVEPATTAASVERGSSAQGRQYTRTVHTDAAGRAIAENWVLHGAGHAWSGGQAAGSYTDATGPDASREMLRFFAQHAPASRPATSADEGGAAT